MHPAASRNSKQINPLFFNTLRSVLTLFDYLGWLAVNIYVLSALAENPSGRKRYWDTVPSKYFSGDYAFNAFKCDAKGLVKIDIFTELKALDIAYDI